MTYTTNRAKSCVNSVYNYDSPTASAHNAHPQPTIVLIRTGSRGKSCWPWRFIRAVLTLPTGGFDAPKGGSDNPWARLGPTPRGLLGLMKSMLSKTLHYSTLGSYGLTEQLWRSAVFKCIKTKLLIRDNADRAAVRVKKWVNSICQCSDTSSLLTAEKGNGAEYLWQPFGPPNNL